MTPPKPSPKETADFGAYAGRWVAHLRGQIVGQGGTPEQAMRAARASRFKEIPQVTYVPIPNPFVFSDVLDRVRSVLPIDRKVYLVGGAVRDALLARPVYDMDFALAGEVSSVGRRVANSLGGAFYHLDVERDTVRVILDPEDGNRMNLDFAALRGPDLESDLRSRDFTINAIAVDVHDPQALLDPLGGASDLSQRLLRECSPTSFQDDPLRILRGIRLAGRFGLHILPDTRKHMKEAVQQIDSVSSERVRDELFHILAGPGPSTAIRALDILGALPFVLPELPALKDIPQPPPHVYDTWAHTLALVQKLDEILDLLAPVFESDKVHHWGLGLVSVRLGRYRTQLQAHLEAGQTCDRPLRSLLLLAGLYHDIAKPQTLSVAPTGQIQFLDHDQLGAQVVAERARHLRLSRAEIDRLRLIVRHHMDLKQMAAAGGPPDRRTIYRFFRTTRQAGVDICLLWLANLLATYGPTVPQTEWAQQVDLVRTLLEAWWERKEEVVSPPVLINGDELMDLFNLPAGPQIGLLLEHIRESQAIGLVHTKDEALDLIRQQLDRPEP